MVTFNPITIVEFTGKIGIPTSSTDVVLLDDDENPVALGERGEIALKGPQVMKGYSWVEEYMAFRQNDVPFNLQNIISERGAGYDKALLPMVSHICVDGKLLIGQNPMSTKALAKKAMEMLI